MVEFLNALFEVYGTLFFILGALTFAFFIGKLVTEGKKENLITLIAVIIVSILVAVAKVTMGGT